MKKLVIIALFLTLFINTAHAGAQTKRRPHASSQGILAGISGGALAVGVGVLAAAAGITLIALNKSESAHAH